MRQGFMIAAVMLWVVINMLGNMAEKEALLSQPDPNITNESGEMTQEDVLYGLMKPEMSDTNLVTIVTKVWDFLKLVGKTITLWHPALWQGSAIYVYFLLIMPIGISFWVVFVMALRGVGSG
jgi:hypothetical protein